MTRTEIVSTHDLREGDVIRHYGATLRLSNRQDWGARPGDAHGACISFAVELVGDDCGQIPRGWLVDVDPRHAFTVQGNRLATWARIVA